MKAINDIQKENLRMESTLTDFMFSKTRENLNILVSQLLANKINIDFPQSNISKSEEILLKTLDKYRNERINQIIGKLNKIDEDEHSRNNK